MATKRDQTHQAHGLTHGQMKELHVKQISDEVENVKGNVDADYELPEHEQHLIHAQLETPQFNRETGERESKPYVQKYSQKEFADQEKNNGFAGLKVTVLHDGSKFKKENVKPTGGNPADDATINTNANAATGNQGTTNVKREKEVKNMNKGELVAKYTELYGEAPDGDYNKEDLQRLIGEKLEFLKEEQLRNNGEIENAPEQ